MPVVVVANKSDGVNIGDYLQDCYDLGLGHPVMVSATEFEVGASHTQHCQYVCASVCVTT